MDVGFSERLTNVIALSTALSNAGQDAPSSRTQAQELEEEMFKRASTTEEYQQRVATFLIGLDSRQDEQHDMLEVGTDVEEVLNSEGPSFGSYEHATFHQDGQMSTIFKARSRAPATEGRIVALKVTHPSMMTAPHNSFREARILDACKIEFVVPLLESFHESGSRFVLVFPFLRQDLENLLRSGTLTTRQSKMIYTALFCALTYVHKLGIIHRDIKPSNILLKTMEGPVCLIDFGIAWSPEDKDSEPAETKITDVGTTCYRPPELLFGHRAYDASLDMWAAGCVVAEIVKQGHHPVFDSGPLGSELGLIKSMFTTLGTPTDETWPSARKYPDWKKMKFQHFPGNPWKDILPGASRAAVDFVSRTVCFETSERLTADEALQHQLCEEVRVS